MRTHRAPRSPTTARPGARCGRRSSPALRSGSSAQPSLPIAAQATAGVLAGPGIGVVAAVMGVAGGELLIPTVVLLDGVDVELAGSLSLLVSLPTMVVAFLRYSRDRAFGVLQRNARFVVAMAVGSVAGGLLPGTVSEAVLVPLVVVLLASALEVRRHA